MKSGDCLVPRTIGYNFVNVPLVIEKGNTNRRSPPGPESQRELVRCVDDAKLDSCTPSSPAHRLRLAM